VEKCFFKEMKHLGEMALVGNDKWQNNLAIFGNMAILKNSFPKTF
jgi:hypothetical protein